MGVKYLTFISGIILVGLAGMMLVLRQAPSEAMWIIYDPTAPGPTTKPTGTLRVSLDQSTIPQPIMDIPTFDSVWSPDGRWVAFTSHDSLYRSLSRNTHGAKAQRIFTNHVSETHIDDLVWSPDSEELAFTINETIFVIRSDGSHLRQFTSDPDTRPLDSLRWSPDGQWMVYVRVATIFRINIDGLNQPPMMLTIGYTPAWSPDGQWIAFTRNDIFKMRPDGSNVTQLTDTSSPFHDPLWSPDGQWIVAEQDYTLVHLRSDGSDLQRLTEIASVKPTWSPDGRWIAYISTTFPRSNIVIIRPDGSQRRELIEPELLLNQSNLSPSSHLEWSPLIDLPINIALLMAISGILILTPPLGLICLRRKMFTRLT